VWFRSKEDSFNQLMANIRVRVDKIHQKYPDNPLVLQSHAIIADRERDFNKSLKLHYQNIKENEWPESMISAGKLLFVCLFVGYGIDKDDETYKDRFANAYDLWWNAANRHDMSDAHCFLASCYMSGNGVSEVNVPEAIRREEEQIRTYNSCMARNGLGDYYLALRHENPNNGQRALKYYLESAGGNRVGTLYVGYCYYLGITEIPEEDRIKKAIDYLKIASTFDAPMAFTLLGLIEKELKHYREALEYFVEGAKRWDHLGQYHLACCYVQWITDIKWKQYAGSQTEWKDDEYKFEAVRLLQASCKQGNRNARTVLGECDETGFGCTKDIQKAKELLFDNQFFSTKRDEHYGNKLHVQ
jgi:TPR repeat protein